jgi:Bacterial mobilisation protein (MobC)
MDGSSMTANDTSQPLLKRSGSQKRQRKHTAQVALTAAELTQAEEKAQACGLSLSSYGRAAMLGSPGPRAKRRAPVNAEALARATAALNKAGSNLNQIAHQLNAGGATATAQECFAALAEARAAAAAIREIVGRKDRP